MPRYVAFLRAINVGGHNVKMEALKGCFEALGLDEVETFIASGNVIFRSRAREATLAAKIAGKLHAELGYEVATFLRTDAEVAGVAGHEAFPRAKIEAAGALVVGFLAAPLSAAATKALAQLETDVDELRTHGREIYWLCRTRQSQSQLANAVFERKLRVQATFRNITTVRKLAAKLAPDEPRQG